MRHAYVVYGINENTHYFIASFTLEYAPVTDETREVVERQIHEKLEDGPNPSTFDYILVTAIDLGCTKGVISYSWRLHRRRFVPQLTYEWKQSWLR